MARLLGKRLLVIGAGPAGLTAARCFADAGCEVQVVDQRDHIGGNCFDEIDDHGVLVHRYGPHYFRTSNRDLLNWLSRFTGWIPGRYYVRASIAGKLVPLPISLATMTALKERVFSRKDFECYLEEQRVPNSRPVNAEEQCLALIGRELYDLIFRSYTTKQWGIAPVDLDPSVTARIPLRFDWDERYVCEEFQVMPRKGFTAMFGNMADHENVTVETGVDVDPTMLFAERHHFDATIYTGPIDRLFGYRFGRLGYRSLRFEYEHHNKEYVQPCVQINHPNTYDYTRTVEIKHVTGQKHPVTAVCYEYPEDTGDPFYPLLIAEHKARYSQYRELAENESRQSNPIFLIGRLAEFRYFNTDQVIERSRNVSNRLIEQSSK